MSKHDRIYNVLLMVMGFFFLIAMGTMIALRGSPTVQPNSRWAITMVAFVEGSYVAAIAATVTVRLAAPKHRRMITMAMNIVLLVYFPIGTPLGIYGLWKVDKQKELPGFPVEPGQS